MRPGGDMPTGRLRTQRGIIHVTRIAVITAIATVAIVSPRPAVSAASRIIDPLLSQTLQSGDPLAPVQAIVTFSQKPGLLDLAALSGTGVQIAPFRQLPMVAIQGTRLQVSAVATLTLPTMV